MTKLDAATDEVIDDVASNIWAKTNAASPQAFSNSPL